MSRGPYGVAIVDYGEDEEIVSGQATFDTLDEAMDAVEVLFQFWAFDTGNGKRVEIERV